MIFELVTTKNCNLNCTYCFEGKKSKIKMPISSIEHIINFIEDLRNSNLLYDNKNIQIDFNGGETLLNKQFIFSFIKLTQNHGYRYSLTTNGTLIDQEVIDLINKYKINIQVSLDGNKKSHDLNRKFNNSEGSFDIVLLKLKEIQSKCPNIKLTTVCVVTPETVKNFAENVKFLFFNGFYDIGTTVCSDYIWSENDYLEYKKQLKILGDFYIKCIEENNYFSFNVFRNKIENTLLGFSKGKCDAIKGQLAILPDGSILPCGVFIGCKNEEDFYIGDIKKGIDSKKVNWLLDSVEKIDYSSCKKCSLFGRCKNDCMALNNRINKNMLKCDLTTCYTNQIEIFEVDRILEYFFIHKNKNFYKYFKQYLPKDYIH